MNTVTLPAQEKDTATYANANTVPQNEFPPYDGWVQPLR